MDNFSTHLLFLALLCGQAASTGYSNYVVLYCLPGGYGPGGAFYEGYYTCHAGNVCSGGASVFSPPPCTQPANLGSSIYGGSGCCLPKGYSGCTDTATVTYAAPYYCEGDASCCASLAI